MKKLIAILIATAMACAFAPMVGADNPTIEVTLNPQATASITCDRATWEPSCKLGGTEQTATDWGNVTNNGDVSVSITIAGSDTANWFIDTSPSLDHFVMMFYDGEGWNGFTTAESFNSNVEPTDSVPFGLNVTMPTYSSVTDTQHVTITFEATALTGE